MVESMYRNCELRVDNVALKTNLISFELDEIEVILGMDFLTKYHAVFDCSNKDVVLRNPKSLKSNL